MQEKLFGGENGGSYRWEAPLNSYNDLEKLHYSTISVDSASTNKLVSLAQDIFKDILEVRLKGTWWWSLGMTFDLIKLRGAERIFYDMYDYPEKLHNLMSFLRDENLAKLDFLESSGLLTLNNDGSYVGSGGFGYTTELPQPDFDGTRVRCCDLWGFAESQETCTISPAMFEEFVFQYQLTLLRKFGLNNYGCCEPLHSRWNIIERIPRLRRVSVSPWADISEMADYLGNRFVFSRKPNPVVVATPSLDEDAVRKDIRKTLRATKGCVLELILKDTHTICNNPSNIIRWCRITKEEVGAL
jgi:hypothetical protein